MKKDSRTEVMHIRLSKKELEQLDLQMKNQGYRSRSMYVRARLLDKRIRIDKDVVLTDRAFRNQINALSTKVAKIGVDYNQATKRFNSLAKQTRADGSPVINARAANYYLRQVSTMTSELKNIMEKVIELVLTLELKQSSEDSNRT